MDEDEAWLAIAERIKTVGTPSGLCYELLALGHRINDEMYHRMRARLKRTFRFRAWWRRTFCANTYYWPRGKTEPRIAACYELAALAAKEQL